MSDFPPPYATPEEERQYMMDVIKAGLRFLIITAFFYTGAIWVVSRILNNSGIIDGALSWGSAAIIGVGGIILRTWDRTFFK